MLHAETEAETETECEWREVAEGSGRSEVVLVVEVVSEVVAAGGEQAKAARTTGALQAHVTSLVVCEEAG